MIILSGTCSSLIHRREVMRLYTTRTKTVTYGFTDFGQNARAVAERPHCPMENQQCVNRLTIAIASAVNLSLPAEKKGSNPLVQNVPAKAHSFVTRRMQNYHQGKANR